MRRPKTPPKPARRRRSTPQRKPPILPSLRLLCDLCGETPGSVLLPAVEGVDVADGAGAAAHHQRVRARAVAGVFHTLEHLAAGDASRGEGDVVRGDQIVHRVDALQV